jgi:diguanylate cyclase (GGDEF)-like protein/PAS domain S-box-containing protein
MTDRNELAAAALDALPEGIAIVGLDRNIAFWNPTAESITGFTEGELVMQPSPEPLEPLLLEPLLPDMPGHEVPVPGHGALVHARHKLGHDLMVIARVMVLRNPLGELFGTLVVFHPAESLDALPHGESAGSEEVAASQTELEDRLQIEMADFALGGLPFGVLWITVDQGHELRATHGAGACRAAHEKVQRAMATGLRPAEELGRWGDDEFLVISHERTPEMLAAHAQKLTGLARTADFRWWGDRVSLTVSIGVAQAEKGEPLTALLERAREAMSASVDAGGNHITQATGGRVCLRS